MIEITEVSKDNIGAFSDLILPSERAGIVNSDTVSVGVYEDDVPVGAVMARITDEGFAVVTSFMVKKEKRGRGFGTNLLYEVLQQLLKKESISRLELRFSADDEETEGLRAFLTDVGFEMTEDETHGAYTLNIADAEQVPSFKKASTAGIRAYSNTGLQIRNKIIAAHPMLAGMVIEDAVSCIVEEEPKKGGIHDCLLFAKFPNLPDTLVMVWAESSNNMLDLVRMLKFSLDAVLKKYGTDVKIRIPYIHEHSKKLIEKLMGEKLTKTETVWNAVLPITYEEQE